MMWQGMGDWGWGTGIGWFFMLSFWVLVIVGIVTLIRWLIGASSGSRALDILRERYAKGEITKEQFEQTKREIQP
jgi:putative membrane protein